MRTINPPPISLAILLGMLAPAIGQSSNSQDTQFEPNTGLPPFGFDNWI